MAENPSEDLHLFLDELKKSIVSDEVTDADMSKIIAENILTEDPEGNRLSRVMSLIKELAETRASAPKENSDA